MPPRNAVTWKRDPDAGPVLSYSAPFSLDTIIGGLNKTVFKPAAILAIPLLAWANEIRKGTYANPFASTPYTSTGQIFTGASLSVIFSQIKTTVANNGHLRRFFYFIVALNLHRAATRYIKNLGHYKRDPANFKQDVIVITGGSAGIGRAVVELLSHKHKAKIAVLDMAEPTYAAAPRGAPEILYVKTDVTSTEAVAAAAKKIKEVFKSDPVILVNNAGIVDGRPILETDLEAVLRVFRVNTLAHYVTVKQFLPAMISRGHGHVVSVASAASYMSIPQLSNYAVSKAGALAFHEALTGELRARYGPKARKIRTTVCCPTKVRTALGDGLEDQGNQFTTPTLEPIQVAVNIVGAIESGLSGHFIMPGIMNMLPIVSRGPAWLRRIVELIGDTDFNVSDKGAERAIANGYGANFEGEDAELWKKTQDRVAAAKNKT